MAGENDLQAALESGEALRYQAPLRGGGEAGLTDDRLLISDETATAVDFENVEEITVQSVDWFLTFMGVLIVVFGLYSTRFNVIAGVAFALVGLASIYRTYGKRGEALVRVRGRSKPLRLYPEDVEAFQSAARRALDAKQAGIDAEGEPGR